MSFGVWAPLRLWILLLAVWLGWPMAAIAQDHISERAWLEDPSRQLTWADVQQRHFDPYTDLLSKGFGHSIIWLRLRIDPVAHPPSSQGTQSLILRIRPVYLDDIQVFDPLAPHGLAGVTGDMHHPRLDEYEGMDFLLPIARGTQARDIWLRLDSTSTRQIDVQALDDSDLRRITQHQQLLSSIYAGLVLLLAVWGLGHWLVSHEAIIGLYGIAQTTALGFALGSLGFLRFWWPAGWPPSALHHSISIFSVLSVSSAIAFHIYLSFEFTPPRWIRLLQKGLLTLLPIKLVLLLIGQTILALQINMSEILLVPFLFLLTASMSQGWSAPDIRERPSLARSVVIGFYLLMGLVLVLAALPGLGLVGSREVTLYLVQIHGLLSGLLVLALLQYRTHMQHKQQRETGLALERSQLLAQQEREVREEQDKLLAMLAHELKTPLATMHMRLDANASGSQEIKHAIRDMNAVIERCLQTARFDDRQLRPRLERCHLGDLVQEAVSICPQPSRVTIDMPAAMSLQSDRQLLFIVLSNLLENACKYAAPHTAIRITGRETDVGCTLEITNLPGPSGWPDANQLFAKYYRSPHARRQAGTGLGLYLVHSLMHVLGGHIEYCPDADTIRFMLHLPHAATPADH